MTRFHMKGTPEEFKEHLAGTSTKVIVMEPGETIRF